jgi:hypothetical protein
MKFGRVVLFVVFSIGLGFVIWRVVDLVVDVLIGRRKREVGDLSIRVQQIEDRLSKLEQER